MKGPVTVGLDLAAVERWMSRAVDGFTGPLTARQFAAGQSNPTFRLDTPAGSYVLRRKPAGALLRSAHAVEREFRVQNALAATDVPVPRMLALCEDESVIGSTFYVMSHVEGRNFDDPRIPGASASERAAIYDELNRVLASVHLVGVDAVGLADYGRAGNYFARQIERWTRQYRATETETIPAMDALIGWLGLNQPGDDGRRTLVHGDMRIDNLLYDLDGPRCAAVLDWELSTLGHPFADLAAVLMQWRLPPGAAGRGLAGIDRAALGLPSDDAFVARYCERTGAGPIDNLNFYLAFAFFRMGAIMQGVKRRALDGNASNPARAMEVSALVPRYAAEGLAAAHDG